MATFFNAEATTDLALLAESTRKAPDLSATVDEVEADILRIYTRRKDSLARWLAVSVTGDVYDDGTNYVFLLGYAPLAADADSGLKTALKRAIAEVVRWRIKQKRKDPLMQLESDGGKYKNYIPGANDPFPMAWSRWLAPYDLRPGVYAL